MGRDNRSGFGLLASAHTAAQRLAAELLFERGVSVTEAWVLERITADGDVCASEIADALDVPPSTVTRALRRLEHYGHLTLTKGIFRDARVLRPKLTTLGISVRRGVVGFEVELDHMLLQDLRPIEAAAFLSGLARMTRRAKLGFGVPPARPDADDDSPHSPDADPPAAAGEPWRPRE